MYSKEDKEFALNLWFELRSTISEEAFVAELGWPSASCLSKWIRSDPRFDPDKPLYYSKPILTKLEAIRRVADGCSYKQAAKEACVTPNAVVSWVKKFAQGGTAALLPNRKVAFMTNKKKPRQLPEAPVMIKPPKAAYGELPDDPAALKAMVEELRMDNAILREVLDVLKADPGCNPANLANNERAKICCELTEAFPLRILLGRLGLSRSTYYYQLEVLTRPYGKYDALDERVRISFETSGATYGSESIWADLRKGTGVPVCAADLEFGDTTTPVIVSEKVIRASMHRQGLVSRQPNTKGGGRYSSWEGEKPGRPSNFPLKEDYTHDFCAEKPMQLVVTDVTEFALDGYKAYLSPAIDCFDGYPIAWTVSLHADRLMALTMLDAVQATRKSTDSLTIHTDGGGVYFSNEWISYCAKNGIERSMSRPGHSPDNARAEGFFGTLKNDFFKGYDWSGVGFEEFKMLLDSYITWYRDVKVKKSLGWKSIREYREELGYAA